MIHVELHLQFAEKISNTITMTSLGYLNLLSLNAISFSICVLKDERKNSYPQVHILLITLKAKCVVESLYG